MYRVLLHFADGYMYTMNVDSDWADVLERLMLVDIICPDEVERRVIRISQHLTDNEVSSHLMNAQSCIASHFATYPEVTWSVDLKNRIAVSSVGCTLTVSVPDTIDPNVTCLRVAIGCLRDSEAHRILHAAGVPACLT